jgi:hypothetical protein
VKLHGGEEKFTAPRHRHNFSQIRLVLKGHMDFGPVTVQDPGEVGFFPGGAYYGPEYIDGGEYLLLQWGREWVTRDQDKQAMEELSEKGRFEHGMYYFEEDGVEQAVDGKTAVWEHVYGRPEVVAPARYKTPIVMCPDSFDWIKGSAGTSNKILGRFTEDDVAVELVRWDGTGGTHRLLADRTSMVYVHKGSVRVDGVAHGPETVIWSEFNEELDLGGEIGTEVTIFGLPLDRSSA